MSEHMTAIKIKYITISCPIKGILIVFLREICYSAAMKRKENF